MLGFLKITVALFLIALIAVITIHGRYTCTARKPKCGSCIIEDLCDYKEKTE
jgi:endonuclease III